MAIGRSLTPNYTQAFLIGGIAFAVETVLWIILIRERKPEIPVDAPEMPKTKVGDVLKNKYSDENYRKLTNLYRIAFVR